jgi:hypothetical protein
MNADQALNAVRSIISTIISWLKLAVALGLALIVLSTIAGLLGHPIPYIPAFRGSLQEAGIFTAALAYWLR